MLAIFFSKSIQKACWAKKSKDNEQTLTDLLAVREPENFSYIERIFTFFFFAI